VPSDLSGRLLVAAPLLDDPHFARSVVYLLDADEDGAIGVVLDRPTTIPVHAVIPGWGSYASDPAVIHDGGPVGRESAIGLARGPAELPGFAALPVRPWLPVVAGVTGSLGTVDLNRDADALGAALETLRVFHGHAGWGPGQLEGELEEGAWYVADALAEDLFCERPEMLWRWVLRRQVWPTALVSTLPDDTRLN
jgi:putative transcriptional regulator